MCLDLGIIDKLINILINDDIEIKKEAVWAVSNCTAGATFAQFVSLVEKGILKALTTVLKMREARILAVALEGIENILKAGKDHYSQVHIIYPLTLYSWEKRISSVLNWNYAEAWS